MYIIYIYCLYLFCFSEGIQSRQSGEHIKLDLAYKSHQNTSSYMTFTQSRFVLHAGKDRLTPESSGFRCFNRCFNQIDHMVQRNRRPPELAANAAALLRVSVMSLSLHWGLPVDRWTSHRVEDILRCKTMQTTEHCKAVYNSLQEEWISASGSATSCIKSG